MNKYIAILLLAFSGSAFADPWLCITEHAAGIVFENGKWLSARIAVDDSIEKYIVRKLKKSDTYSDTHAYAVFPFGKDYSLFNCASRPTDDGKMICLGGGSNSTFNFSNITGRFVATYADGYWRDLDDENSDTPLVTIGRCSKI